jgi:hypothetical protein
MMNTTAMLAQEIRTPLQYALDLKEMKELLKTEAEGKEYLPVVLVTGNRIPEVSVTMFGEKVIIVDNKEMSRLIKKGHPFIEMGKASFRERAGKAEFIFFCGEMKVKLKLRRERGQWTLKSISQKNRKNYFWNF